MLIYSIIIRLFCLKIIYPINLLHLKAIGSQKMDDLHYSKSNNTLLEVQLILNLRLQYCYPIPFKIAFIIYKHLSFSLGYPIYSILSNSQIASTTRNDYCSVNSGKFNSFIKSVFIYASFLSCFFALNISF